MPPEWSVVAPLDGPDEGDLGGWIRLVRPNEIDLWIVLAGPVPADVSRARHTFVGQKLLDRLPRQRLDGPPTVGRPIAPDHGRNHSTAPSLYVDQVRVDEEQVAAHGPNREWKETDRESEECARLKALFESNTQSLLGTGAVKESKRAGNQSPMGSIAGDVAANGIVLDRLNAECPGWMDPN